MRTYVSFRHIFLRVKTFKDMLFAANQDTHKCKKHRRRHRRHLQTDLFWFLTQEYIYIDMRACAGSAQIYDFQTSNDIVSDW